MSSNAWKASRTLRFLFHHICTIMFLFSVWYICVFICAKSFKNAKIYIYHACVCTFFCIVCVYVDFFSWHLCIYLSFQYLIYMSVYAPKASRARSFLFNIHVHVCLFSSYMQMYLSFQRIIFLCFYMCEKPQEILRLFSSHVYMYVSETYITYICLFFIIWLIYVSSHAQKASTALVSFLQTITSLYHILISSIESWFHHIYQSLVIIRVGVISSHVHN